MPRYWFTTHYPRLPDGRDTLHVYLQDKHRNAIDISQGDRVFIYEFLVGPNLLQRGKIIQRLPGKASVICEARVSAKLHRREMSDAREIYTDGREANFAWIAETTDRTSGRLPRSRVNTILGYKPGNLFHGFNRGTGIKELEPGVYKAMLAAFLGHEA